VRDAITRRSIGLYSSSIVQSEALLLGELVNSYLSFISGSLLYKGIPASKAGELGHEGV